MTNSNMGQPVKNKHKVPKKVWNKWTNLGRRIFNDMMYNFRPTMQFSLLHPDAPPMKKEHWLTVRWNASWLAADALKTPKRLNGEVQMANGPLKGKKFKSNTAYRKATKPLRKSGKRHAKRR